MKPIQYSNGAVVPVITVVHYHRGNHRPPLQTEQKLSAAVIITAVGCRLYNSGPMPEACFRFEFHNISNIMDSFEQG